MQNLLAHCKAGCPMFRTMHATVNYLSLFSLIILSGCTKQQPTYTLKPLQPRTAYDQITKKTETGEVTVRCATCSNKDLQAVLGKEARSLYSRNDKGFAPIQLYIENNSGYTWSLSPYDIRLPLVDMQEVKQKLNCGATARGLTSFTLTGGCGLALAGLGAAASIFHPVLGASCIGAGCSLMLLAPIRSHNKTARLSSQNIRFEHALDAISLNEDVTVHPREHVNKLIFVKNNCSRDTFLVRLCNKDNPDHTISYTLYLQQDRK